MIAIHLQPEASVEALHHARRSDEKPHGRAAAWPAELPVITDANACADSGELGS